MAPALLSQMVIMPHTQCTRQRQHVMHSLTIAFTSQLIGWFAKHCRISEFQVSGPREL